ncbi:OmpA family protein [Pseudodesulfovibrio senegalensis]|jgi:OOP family OmpA-OmpF porin|nr:OmpA family protein [Pseudodesulfovibrio senegalensis]
MKKLLSFIFFVFLGACAHVDPSITQKTKVYTDAPLHKSKVVMSAQPRGRQLQPLTALFLPFYMQEPTPDYQLLGDQIGGLFYENWRARQMFPIFEFAAGQTFRGRNNAIAMARSRGADLVVVGFVPHMISGSNLGDTDISLQVKIYETRTGALLFDMAQAGRIEFRGSRDWIVVSHEQRMPSSPLFKLVRSMADDMAVPVQSWLPTPGTPLPYANNTEEIVKGMTKTQPGTPPPGNTQATGQSRQTGTNADEKPLTDSSTLERDLKDEATAQQGVSLNILFDVDKDVIRPTSYPLLDSLGQALLSPELKGKSVMVAGHTDSDADAQYNLKLSKRRAEAVKRYLVAKFQIAPERITTVGYGKSNPVAPNDTPKNKQRNRRVEVRVLK